VRREIWLVFALAALGLSLTPGPNGLLALTHSAIYGVWRTVYTVLVGAVGLSQS
jgi:threonine/homoserine/homoserine lactone efflux protein